MISPCCTYETFRVKNKVLDAEYDICKKCGLPWAVTEEEWIPIHGFNSHEVSTTGKIRRKKGKRTRTDGKVLCYSSKELLQSGRPNGYVSVNLNNGLQKATPLVHKLVAENWVLNPHGYKYVSHITGNVRDNSYLNLKWTRNDTKKIRHIGRLS